MFVNKLFVVVVVVAGCISMVASEVREISADNLEEGLFKLQWDDYIKSKVPAKEWDSVKDEISSGALDSFVRMNGQSEEDEETQYERERREFNEAMRPFQRQATDRKKRSTEGADVKEISADNLEEDLFKLNLDSLLKSQLSAEQLDELKASLSTSALDSLIRFNRERKD